MSTSHTFRFGVVAAQARSGQEWAEKSRRIEDLGFSSLVIPDGLQHVLSPFPALAAAAAATSVLRVGTYVIANDYRHPVMLAKEAATLDVLSGGRFELGIGAGRPAAAADNAMIGQPFDSGGVRVARLAEALAIVKPLLSGQPVNHAGTYYNAKDAAISPLPVQQPPPILIAGSQRRLLTLAAREADIVALGLGPNAGDAQVAEALGWVREAAGGRFAQLEINLNLMAVGGQVPRFLAMTLGAAAAAELAQSDAVSVLKGSTDGMCDRLLALREQFGINYLMAGDELVDAIAPVVARMAGR
jgi:probable F420-dependent oxidoreductase